MQYAPWLTDKDSNLDSCGYEPPAVPFSYRSMYCGEYPLPARVFRLRQDDI